MNDARRCPNCDEPAPDGANWCEACGADLEADPVTAPATNPCISCGASPQEISDDGWCGHCGQRQPSTRDHFEIDERQVAAVTDRGTRHHHNEDATVVASRPGGALIVVADGVSSTVSADTASTLVCDAALEVLTSAWDEAPDPLADDVDVDAWLRDATSAAQDAVHAIATATEPGIEPPSSTLVAGVIRVVGDVVKISVGWLGDSRAYWIGSHNAEVLTVDHSWAELQREQGVTEEEIHNDRLANSITRWIGMDATDPEPQIVNYQRSVPGRLIVCSDGLWRYADAPADMAAKSREAGAPPIDAARWLCQFAVDSGGHDNISVAVFDAGADAGVDADADASADAGADAGQDVAPVKTIEQTDPTDPSSGDEER